jgi:hypothetical protein
MKYTLCLLAALTLPACNIVPEPTKPVCERLTSSDPCYDSRLGATCNTCPHPDQRMALLKDDLGCIQMQAALICRCPPQPK